MSDYVTISSEKLAWKSDQASYDKQANSLSFSFVALNI